jgi:NAD(P)-dependent dehydrogenase (short-subunit alcohol dehydrogenase family)
MSKANLGLGALQELVMLTPLARLGQPDDIAEAIAFLVSDNARWITRQNVAVDGGIISRDFFLLHTVHRKGSYSKNQFL